MPATAQDALQIVLQPVCLVRRGYYRCYQNRRIVLSLVVMNHSESFPRFLLMCFNLQVDSFSVPSVAPAKKCVLDDISLCLAWVLQKSADLSNVYSLPLI